MSRFETRSTMNLFEFDRRFFDDGAQTLCGVDEAGRGPLAGPVVAAAVVFRRDVFIDGVNDSKKLAPEKRDALFEMIKSQALSVSLGIVGNDIIDRINILSATHLAAGKAIRELPVSPDLVITDYLKLKRCPFPLRYFAKGDQLSHAIAAASIIAKVTRDRIMMEYHALFPQYNFAVNKGYPTEAHRNALKKFGPCKIHRMTFHGVATDTFL
ncbi:ribonuclease HII [Candidatus Sumerlaeota bacterium]|nr:ribonuclease HII [Candidatus Sumerlaeota bacterium]